MAGLSMVLVAGCAEHNRQDIIQSHKHTIDKGIAEWRSTHDTHCLNGVMPLVDSCIDFQEYCNQHDTLYVESYTYRELKIRMLNSLKRYDEALCLIDQLPDNFGLSVPFGKNYLLKSTLIRKYYDLKDFSARDSIINSLIEDMEFQFRANSGKQTLFDTVFFRRNLHLVDMANVDALLDYFLICIVRGDDKKIMMDNVKRIYSTDEGNNKMYRENLIEWIDRTDSHFFYNM